MGAEVARFRTAGGWHIELALPLSKRDWQRVDGGELVRVDSDGQPVAEDEAGLYARGGELPSGSVLAQNGPGQHEQVIPPEPPRTGKGSGRDAWATYATAFGMQVPEDASRDDILTALIAAGTITAE